MMKEQLGSRMVCKVLVQLSSMFVKLVAGMRRVSCAVGA
jgi:hypothetical protein